MSSSRSDETAESRPEQPLAESSEAMGERREEASPPASGSSSGASIARCLYRPPIATAAALGSSVPVAAACHPSRMAAAATEAARPP